MANGAASKFYFPLQLRRFWCSGRLKQSDNEQDVVEAMGVSKSYGRVDALKPLNLTMKINQVTALLGHNGAGKVMLPIDTL